MSPHAPSYTEYACLPHPVGRRRLFFGVVHGRIRGLGRLRRDGRLHFHVHQWRGNLRKRYLEMSLSSYDDYLPTARSHAAPVSEIIQMCLKRLRPLRGFRLSETISGISK